jgi:hypothetical protein
MKTSTFPGGFLLHPVFVAAMAIVLVNNLWFKSSGICPWLAGKATDFAIMIFLPALICLGVEILRHVAHSVEMVIKKNPRLHLEERYLPSRSTILVSIAVSGTVMALLEISDFAPEIYYSVIRRLNEILFFGRVTAKPVKDLTDLFSLAFLAVPYVILGRASGPFTRSPARDRNRNRRTACG